MQDAPARSVSGGPAAGPAQARDGPVPAAPELTIVVPTFNERENVPLLVERLRQVLQDCAWEVIFVDDDSPDGTADVAKAIGVNDARVRCQRRIGRRGLSGACLEGMLASQARFVAVMDADLQHDERLLVSMLETLRGGAAELAVGTRYAPGGASEGFSTRRLQMSQFATQIARALLGVTLSDPMSGFFMVRRDVIERLAPKLSTQGFKLLLDMVVTAGGSVRIVELPYQFRERQRGESKLDARVAFDFVGLVLAKATGDVVSLRFVFFSAVGLLGIMVHFVALAACIDWIGMRFTWAQTAATLLAIASNFVLNNAFTYRDQRLVGPAFFIGLARFYVVSIIGALSNVGVGNWLFSNQQTWWVAGLGGAFMGLVWNYVVASLVVWRSR
ncbi:MAG: glycosyltransferase family 2 protein [Xanthobacteraceae bacterium]